MEDAASRGCGAVLQEVLEAEMTATLGAQKGKELRAERVTAAATMCAA